MISHLLGTTHNYCLIRHYHWGNRTSKRYVFPKKGLNYDYFRLILFVSRIKNACGHTTLYETRAALGLMCETRITVVDETV